MSIFGNLKKYTKDEELDKSSTKTEDDESKRKLSIFSRILLHGGNAADLGSTIHALKNDNVKEANPIYGENPSALKLGLIKSGGSIGIDFALSKMAKKKPKLANGVAKGIGIGMLAVAANNMKQASNK